MSDKLSSLYTKRQQDYLKDPSHEDFFLGMNRSLQEREVEFYQYREIEQPIIFVFGPPRSGTTLISQLIASCCDVGYINNLMARFWLTPIHGIRLSKAVLGDQRAHSFQSNYARTQELTDIHEFGYFWRHHLKKEHQSDVVFSQERESTINWEQLKVVLASMQQEFGGAMVFKNIFGSYHLTRLKALLEKVIYVYIRRDPLDTAISILEARKKYYQDLNTWWSYTPIEYLSLKDLDYWQQIAGQVYYLRKYYDQQVENLNAVSIAVEYADLVQQPNLVLEQIAERSRQLYQQDIALISSPPPSLPFRSYSDRDADKQRFEKFMKQFKMQDEHGKV